MNRQITILNELEATAPVLAHAFIALPYQVPNEYFTNFASTLLSKLTNDKFVGLLDDNLSFPKNLSKQTPYQVPIGYFKGLENNILSTIKTLEEDEKAVILFVNTLSPNNPYQVPDGYFDTFANSVTDKGQLSKNIDVESYPKTTPYKIPNQYFDQLAGTMLNNVLQLDSSVDFTIIDFPKTIPYQVPSGYFDGVANKVIAALKNSNKGVPQGYFDSLPAILLHKVKQSDAENELTAIAPLLNKVSRHNINHVPAGYFGKLEPYISEEANIFDTQNTKTISLKNKSQSHWLRNAIAACIIGTLGFTAYKLIDQPTQTNEGTASNIQPKILLANIDVDKELSKLDDTTIAMYLDNDTFTESTAADFQEVRDDNVDQVLQKIPDADLQQHLSDIEEPNKKRK